MRTPTDGYGRTNCYTFIIKLDTTARPTSTSTLKLTFKYSVLIVEVET